MATNGSACRGNLRLGQVHLKAGSEKAATSLWPNDFHLWGLERSRPDFAAEGSDANARTWSTEHGTAWSIAV